MRLSHSLAVGSPTVRVVAIMAATFLLILAMALVGVAGTNLLAADGAIVVDPAGNGDFTTISEAVAAADDGDTVLIMAGTYPESVVVERSITIRGEEPGAAIIEVASGCTTDQINWETTCPPEVPMREGGEINGPFGMALEGADVAVEDVHFHFGAQASGVIVDGGTVSLNGISSSVDDVGSLTVPITGGAQVTIGDSDLGWGSVSPDRSSHLVIEGSTFGDVVAESYDGIEPHIVRNNVIRGKIWSAGPTIIDGNEFLPIPDRVTNDSFIIIQGGRDWVVRDNVIVGATGTWAALDVQTPAGPGSIEGNTFTDNVTAVTISNDSVIRGNTIAGGEVGIQFSGGAAQVEDNTVEGQSQYGITMAFAEPVMTGNRLCGSTVDLFLGTRAEPVIDDDNEICVTDSID